MAQSLDAQVRVSPLRRGPNAFELPGGEAETNSARLDVFRLVVALTGLVAFLALPAAVVVGVALLLR